MGLPVRLMRIVARTGSMRMGALPMFSRRVCDALRFRPVFLERAMTVTRTRPAAFMSLSLSMLVTKMTAKRLSGSMVTLPRVNGFFGAKPTTAFVPAVFTVKYAC